MSELASGRGEVLWTPPDDAWTASAIGRFATRHGFSDYASLHAWSVSDVSGFWGAATEACGLRWDRAPDAIVENAVLPGARWFVGGELNYASHALARATDPGFADRVAIVARSQTRDPDTVTWSQLAARVRSVASWLRGAG
ncbi:MAG: acetoacetate--CoA ligase, partial [Actinomycetota bacterium]|nr:acetoacetate--CoA ligase [Actinomycetota bacterium]